MRDGLRMLCASVGAGLCAMLAVALWRECNPAIGAEPDETTCRILFTSDVAGFLEPCGCEKGQFGGLPRRATAIGSRRAKGDLTIDMGNLGSGISELAAIGWSHMLGSIDAMQYDVLVPGATEVALCEELARRRAELKSVRVVCANLLKLPDRKPVFDPYVVKTLPDGTRLAVVGHTSDSQPAPIGYAIRPLAESVEALRAELARAADAVVVAGWIEGKPALDLAAACPDLALVLGGKVARGAPELLRRAGAPVALGGERGQYLTVVEMGRRGAAKSSAQVWLGPDVRDDPEMAGRISAWRAELVQKSDAVARSAQQAFAAEGRIGSAACASCHASEHAAWVSSGHAHAMRTLKVKDEASNPLCTECHLADVRDVGGRRELDREGGVGCEACHGGGSRHAAARRRGDAPDTMNRMGLAGERSCLRCHDRDHSAGFEFSQHWQRVLHGTPRKEGKR